MKISDKINIYKTVNRAINILQDYDDALDHLGWKGRKDEVNEMIRELNTITNDLGDDEPKFWEALTNHNWLIQKHGEPSNSLKYADKYDD